MPLDAQHLMDTMQHRRSYGLRDVLPDPIDLGDVALMLEAAHWAPSHGQTQPWQFSVYSGEARRGLGAAFLAAAQGDPRQEEKQRDKVWMAPVWISLGLQPNPKNPLWEERAALAMAVQNAHLMAATLGLAAKWSSGAVNTHPLVAQFVGLEPPAELLGFLYVGKPARPLAAKRTPWQAHVQWFGGEEQRP